MKAVWQLQEAKNRLSEVVNLALTKGAQTITRHGKPVVVVVSQEEFQGRKKGKKKLNPVEVLQACPYPEFLEYVKRAPDKARDVKW